MKVKERFLGLKLNVKFTIIIVMFVMVPIIILASILLQSTKRSVIEENISYMKYNCQRNEEQIRTRMDAINMVTQFFLKDEGLLTMLQYADQGVTLDTKSIRNFKNINIASLERLVNNNASLYGVRVYSMSDDIQEMMPILYQHSRMEQQDWADIKEDQGWAIGYTDKIFDFYHYQKSNPLISLITPVYNNEKKQIATIEAVMTMEEMFPNLYENTENQWSYLVEKGDNVHFGMKQDKVFEDIADKISSECSDAEEPVTYYKEMDGRNVIATYMKLKDIDSEFIIIKDMTDTITQLDVKQHIFSFVMIILTIVMALVIHGIVKLLLKKLYDIIAGIHKVQKGDMNIHFEENSSDEMSELGSQINKMMERIRTLMNESIQREVLMKNSEIKALQNQINAHFIYNVLEAIKMMAEIDEKYDISDSITSLGELLRYGMKWTNSHVTVEQEIAYIKNYIQLMNLRYDFVVQLSINIPEDIYEQQIPKMSLQPIIENAIGHGIEEMAEDATIYMKAVIQEDDYFIEITDSGKGMNKKQVDLLMQKIYGKIEVSGGSGNGIGLKNVQDRIQLAFGDKYGIKIISKEGCFTKIIIRLPFTSRIEGQTERKELPAL